MFGEKKSLLKENIFCMIQSTDCFVSSWIFFQDICLSPTVSQLNNFIAGFSVGDVI